MSFFKSNFVSFGKTYDRHTCTFVPIEWKIANTCHNKLFLLARKPIEIKEINPDCKENIHYSTSQIRTYLNEAYFEQCFSSKEQECILDSMNMNRGCYGVLSGFEEATCDKIFPISVDEGIHLMLGNQRSGRFLNFTQSEIFNTYLRTAGADEGKFVYVDETGKVDNDGKQLEKRIFVLPALWVDRKKFKNYLTLKSKFIKPTNQTLVKFGRYQEKDILWYVIKEKDGTSKLLCKKTIEKKEMNESGFDCSWATSSLREWLNNEFLQKAFNQQEQKKLVLQDIVTASYPRESKNGLPNCKDYVTLLDYKEFLELEENLQNCNEEYWLRNHGNVGTADDGFPITHPYQNWMNIVHNSYVYTMYVDDKGQLDSNGTFPKEVLGVRPVIQIKL